MLKVTMASPFAVHVAGDHPYALAEGFAVVGKDVALIAMEVASGFAKMVVVGGTDVPSVGDVVRPTGHVLSTRIPEKSLGRVVDPFGVPQDGQSLAPGPVLPVFAPPVPMIDRLPVREQLFTGVNAIDWMLPLGLGQRQLVLGDAMVGKTSLVLGILAAQRTEDVVNIYVSIGQRSSALLDAIGVLSDQKVLEKTLVVAAAPSAPPLVRYAAPYAAMAVAERWARAGKHVVMVIDDLTRHAEAYREVSLLLRRPPGRDAYPGDIFYAHASLLDRAGRFGDGSITVLPVSQTQDEELTSYITSNAIAITDGQIYLSKEMFLRGETPAIDLRLSVSRIGSAVLDKSVAAATNRLRVDVLAYEDSKRFFALTGERSFRLAAEAVVPALRQAAFQNYTRGQSAFALALAVGETFASLPRPDLALASAMTVLREDADVRAIASSLVLKNWTMAELSELADTVFGPAAARLAGGVGGFGDNRLFDVFFAKGGK